MCNEELIKEVQAGNNVKQNMLYLYQNNLPLLQKWAKKYFAFQGYEDVLQECYIALDKAVKGFDLENECKFTTYLQTAVLRHLARCKAVTNGMRISNKYKLLLMKYKNLTSEEHSISDNEACCKLHCSLEQLEHIKRYILITNASSIDKQFGDNNDGDDCSLLNLIEADCNIEADYEQKDLQRIWGFVDNALNSDQQKAVIEGRYKNGKNCLTLSKEMGLSHQYIGLVENNALKNLKKDENIRQLAIDYIGLIDIAYHYGYNAWKNNGASCVELGVELQERKKQDFEAFKAEFMARHNIA